MPRQSKYKQRLRYAKRLTKRQPLEGLRRLEKLLTDKPNGTEQRNQVRSLRHTRAKATWQSKNTRSGSDIPALSKANLALWRRLHYPARVR